MAKYDKADLDRRMHGAVESLKHDLAGLRTGRAHTALLDPVTVEVYGSHMPLNQLASISAPEPRMLSVQVWDKSMVKAVETAIVNSNLGLSPATEGQVIRLRIPELNEERRKEFVKLVREKGEQSKVALRNVRRKAKDDLDALKAEVGEDDLARAEKELDAVTKAHVDQIDAALKVKEAELLEV